MSEVYEATQIVLAVGQVSYLIGRLSVGTAVQIAKVLNTVYLSKWRGKTTLNRFRNIKGDDFAFVNVHTEDRTVASAIEKEMEVHGILLARLPDLCGGDQNTQYVISPSDMGKFKAFLIDHNFGPHGKVRVGLISAADYAATAQRSDGRDTPEFQNLRQMVQPQLTGKRPAGMLERGGTLEKSGTKRIGSWGIEVKLHDAMLQGKTVKWIEDQPIKQHKNWAMYKTPDGESAILIPREDVQGYRKGTDGAMYPPRAAIFPDQNYMVLSLRDGTQTLISGDKVASEMGKEDIEERNNRLMTCQQEIRQHPEEIVRITVNERLFGQMEGDREYITRIPYQKERFVAFPKSDAFLNHSASTLSVYLKKGENYRIVDSDGHTVEWVAGQDLMKNYKINRQKSAEEVNRFKTEPQKETIAQKPLDSEAIWNIQEKSELHMSKVTVMSGSFSELGGEYLIKIPHGREEYIRLPKDACFAQEGKGLIMFLKDWDEYRVTDREGNRDKWLRGEELRKYGTRDISNTFGQREHRKRTGR